MADGLSVTLSLGAVSVAGRLPLLPTRFAIHDAYRTALGYVGEEKDASLESNAIALSSVLAACVAVCWADGVTADPSKADPGPLPLPKLSAASLANADSWIWFAFASMIFFIVTAVAALYMQVMENNIRNLAITRDYDHRRRQLTQLHMLDLADKPA